MAAEDDHPINFENFTFDARPDTIDFRDKMFEPTLIEVPTRIDLEDYLQHQTPILNQGTEGACTGFGLSTVANYLLRKRKVVPDSTPVSQRMLYEMAKRYDEWPGEDYQGSSARGATKGWHKHGVCSAEIWSYTPGEKDTQLTQARTNDAAKRPLGAYYRVNHKDLVAMHSALAEVGVLFATAWAHVMWFTPDKRGMIPYKKDVALTGGHAFAIVAYDERGFWIQNSWGITWGEGGFGQISYDDWLANGLDIWVARLGVPVSLRVAESTALTIAPGNIKTRAYAFSDLRPHIISIAENGELKPEKTFGTSETDVAEIFKEYIPSLTHTWEKKRLLLYAHGGLINASSLIQRVSEYRAAFLSAQVYPLAFMWYTDFWKVLTTVLQEAFKRRRPEGALNSSLDFMLDRLDDTLEPLARYLGGAIQWDEVRLRARLATINPLGAVRVTLQYLSEWVAKNPDAEVHLLAHSAGSLFMGPLVKLLTTQGEVKSGLLRGTTGYGIPVTSCTLWAPGIGIREFKRIYLPAIRSDQIQRFSLYTLTDEPDQNDHCAHIYNKSLLYLISNALAEQRNEPILGMEKFLKKDKDITNLLKDRIIEWVRAPNNALESSRWASTARHHGDFDDDPATLRSTLFRILQSWEELPEFDFKRSEESLRQERAQLDTLTE